jgi:hypothetical protein
MTARVFDVPFCHFPAELYRHHIRCRVVAYPNREVIEMVMTMTERAINALTKMSSYLAFEDLQGDGGHCSRLYHYICTETPFSLFSAWNSELPREQNNRRTAELLLELSKKRMRMIALLAHTAEEFTLDNPELALFVACGSNDSDQYKNLALALGHKFQQQRVCAYKHRHLRIYDLSGSEKRVFNIQHIQPGGIKGILTAITGREYTSVQSGFLNANPISLAGPVYGSVGLFSDVPLGLRRFPENAKVRYRAFETPAQADFRNQKDIQGDASAWALNILKLRERGSIAKADKEYAKLSAFCAQYRMNPAVLLKAAAHLQAGVLAANLHNAKESGRPERESRCLQKLENFCLRYQLDPIKIIAHWNEEFVKRWKT